ncbi:MAG: methyltransferase domain-containing protein [Verrucomicrobia bacterium]|jgi:ubiquinone/menaquinone biosynthesis C-methylase UbiE|nr:methyltransferase domain-containing protein [Verrucomicrobiota bacterium]
MDAREINAYFDAPTVVAHYAQAAGELGLWRSEEKIFTRLFHPDQSILELGCGCGRIAIGLHELGFRNVLASDFSKEMIARARHLAKMLEYSIPFRVCDATQLEFEAEVFDGAIFGFNGLMQISTRAGRERALREVLRVLRPGAWFCFTTHDRERSPHQAFWAAEKSRWEVGGQNAELEVFGDRAEATEDGLHFMHVPSQAEMTALLEQVGFRLEATVMRSELAREPAAVEAFADDCRFWVVQKPD